MAVMTSGLRKLAGDRLRLWLARSTRSTLSGVATGATVTALVQSSSATTVAAIGFVGAQLITFTQALGIIFGANIGTTITGWMIVLVGFKLKLVAAALPLLFIAASCYLFKNNPFLRGFGKALAGFCLIFIGISYLQDGLSQFENVIDLSQWPAENLGGRFLLLFVGILITLVTQSSSATVATAITALHASVIDLPQAAAIIIGADIGTTGTAALATIGGSTAARRTGFAHVIYNLMAGMAAFLALPLYLWIWDRFAPAMVTNSPEIVAVAFHTAFNALGVALILPFTQRFAHLIERLFPERRSRLSAAFDLHLLDDAPSALSGLEFGVRQISAKMLRHAEKALRSGRSKESLAPINEAVGAAREFAIQLGKRTSGSDIDTNRLFACLHALDHVNRLRDRSRDEKRSTAAQEQEELAQRGQTLANLFQQLALNLETAQPLKSLPALKKAADELEQDKAQFRQGAIRKAAAGELDAEDLEDALGADRWLRRMAYHAWRIGRYLE